MTKKHLALSRGAIFSLPLLLMLLYACASPGTPSGGPRDEDPPRFVRASPMPGSVNVDKKKVFIEFDEIVNVKDAFSKVVVSPTSSSVPRVSSLGRRVIIDFQDTLAPNTTYTVDFANSIEDNNEGNKLQGFTYTFSTGAEIDTLQISGMVLGARNLEPQQGILVGIHSSVTDTTFSKVRLERVAKTDDRGRFTIRGLKPGAYRVFALADINNDYRWDNPDEDIAFLDFDVSPSFEFTTVTDTIWNLKTGKVDSTYQRMRTRFLPNDILLNSFNIGYKSQYLVKYERPDSLRLSFIFNTRQPELPEISIPAFSLPENWYRLERNATNDTLTYWLTDSRLISADTLFVAARYLRTDSAKLLSAHNDTLRMIRPKVKATKNDKKKGKKEEKADSIAPPTPLLAMNFSGTSAQDVYAPVTMEFATPLDTLYIEAFHLEQKVDTLWQPAPKPLEIARADSLSQRRYAIRYPWEYGGEYRLTADSIAAVGIYGLHTGPATQNIKVKKEEDYCSLKVKVTGLPDSIPAFVELLNGQDQPIRISRVVNGFAEFRYLGPSTYYMRLVEDLNGNGEYDTGDYDTRRQPELVYYYPKALKIKANWDVEQTWNLHETPLDLQKPEALKKNKPERKKGEQQQSSDEEEEDAPFDVNSNPFAPKR